MTFRTGHISDLPDVIARRLGLHHHPEIGAMRAGTLPLRTTNRESLPVAKGGPGVLDQHDTGSCEGHAHGAGITLRFAIDGTPLPELVSPVGLYLGALRIDRAPLVDGTLPPLFDNGTMPSSILTALAADGMIGASVWGQYPASSQTLYANPNSAPGASDYQACIEPPPEKLFAESGFRMKGGYFVQSQGAQRLLDLMTVLAAGKVVTDALPASGGDFQGYSGGILGATTGPIDHANLILDYDWTGTQGQLDTFIADVRAFSLITAMALADQFLVFHVLNSWGETWGEADPIAQTVGGLYRCNRAHIDCAADFCTLDLVRA
jgi:hypothetical protein